MQTFLTDDNVRLAYTDSGKGMPVVLIAGYSAPAIGWCAQEKFLKDSYRVICFDRRSHGRSENPDFGQNMARQGQDIHCLLEHLKLDKAILVGQSQGASSVFSYISQYGYGRLAGIIDIDQTPKMLNDDTWSYGMYGLNAETRPTYFDAPLAAPNNVPLNKKIVLKVLIGSIGMRKFDTETTRPLLLDHADADWRHIFPGLGIPALFIAGEKSPFWPKEHAVSSAQMCPKGEYAVVSNSGHAVNWEFPDECNRIMYDFLSRCV